MCMGLVLFHAFKGPLSHIFIKLSNCSMNIKPLPHGSLVPPWQNEAVTDNIKGKCKNKRFLLISY